MKTLLNKHVVVRLKWNKIEYRGKLVAFDSYMNFQLDDAVEVAEKSDPEEIGELFIRCNNVLFIRENNEASE